MKNTLILGIRSEVFRISYSHSKCTFLKSDAKWKNNTQSKVFPLQLMIEVVFQQKLPFVDMVIFGLRHLEK